MTHFDELVDLVASKPRILKDLSTTSFQHGQALMVSNSSSEYMNQSNAVCVMGVITYVS